MFDLFDLLTFPSKFSFCRRSLFICISLCRCFWLLRCLFFSSPFPFCFTLLFAFSLPFFLALFLDLSSYYTSRLRCLYSRSFSLFFSSCLVSFFLFYWLVFVYLPISRAFSVFLSCCSPCIWTLRLFSLALPVSRCSSHTKPISPTCLSISQSIK